jgi:octaprenyl-diphosphate synthase
MPSTNNAAPSDAKAQILRILSPIAADMKAVDEVIRSELSSDVPRMHEISEYITSAGGKRMRPAILMLMCRAMGYEGTLHQYLGAAIELLHTATLMHDDVVDESDLRRGRPTANSRWGNGAAVLVGDFLYTRSFQMMVHAGNLGVMQALSNAANRLAEGEVVQMVNAHDPSVDEARYFRVIERKTACLFEAAARMAAAIAGCSKEKEEAAARYALCLGNAFQIADDILDYSGNTAETGKNLGADLREGKVTLPLIYARENCTDEEREMINEAVRKGHGDFASIAAIVQKSKALDRCRERAKEELGKGREALACFAPSQFRDSLIELLAFTVGRDR